MRQEYYLTIDNLKKEVLSKIHVGDKIKVIRRVVGTPEEVGRSSGIHTVCAFYPNCILTTSVLGGHNQVYESFSYLDMLHLLQASEIL